MKAITKLDNLLENVQFWCLVSIFNNLSCIDIIHTSNLRPSLELDKNIIIIIIIIIIAL